MKRPLTLCCIFMILGILTGQYITQRVMVVLFFSAMLLVSAFIAIQYRSRLYVLFALVFYIGFARVSYKAAAVTDIGWVASPPTAVTASIKAVRTILPEDLDDEEKKLLILDAKYEHGGVRLRAYVERGTFVGHGSDADTVYDTLAPGDAVIFSGKFSLPEYRRNPGGYNEYYYFASRGISYKATLSEMTRTKSGEGIQTAMYRLRCKMADVYDMTLPASESGILKALVLGDKDGLDESVNELYRLSGISHIIAISGMHLSIISYAFYFLLTKVLRIKTRPASLVTIGFLLLYTIFTGVAVSTVRALVMASTVLLGAVIIRKHDFFTSISLAAIILLMYQPLYLFDIGFQLSFAAVLGIVIFSAVLDGWYFIPKILRRLLGSTLGATLATLPLMLYHFYMASLIGIVINIIVLPFVAIILCVGFLFGIIGIFTLPVATFLAGIVYFILRFYYYTCTFFVAFPMGLLNLGQPHVVYIIAYYCLFLLPYIILIPKYEAEKSRVVVDDCLSSNLNYGFSAAMCSLLATLKGKTGRLIIYLTVTVLFASVLIYELQPQRLTVTFLDVGQGDCTVIETPGSKTYIIDGGGNLFRHQMGLPNTGIQVLHPYLKYRGVKEIDAIFVTHPDADHILGILEIIPSFKISKIYVSNTAHELYGDNELHKALLNTAEQYKIPVYTLSRGAKITLDDDVMLTCMSPSEGYHPELNNTSLVLKLQHKAISFLFTGDIERAVESELFKSSYSALKSDVLKVAHHGSGTSSTEEFVKAVSPQIAMAGSGINNVYAHPNHEVTALYKKLMIPFSVTALDGACILYSDGASLRVRTIVNEEKSRYEQRDKK